MEPFTPTLFSGQAKATEGVARELYERSAQRHIERQSKARTQKMQRQNVPLPNMRNNAEANSLKLPGNEFYAGQSDTRAMQHEGEQAMNDVTESFSLSLSQTVSLSVFLSFFVILFSILFTSK